MTEMATPGQVLTMALYCGQQVDVELAKAAASFVAASWRTDIAVIEVNAGDRYALFDLREDHDGQIRARAVTIVAHETSLR